MFSHLQVLVSSQTFNNKGKSKTLACFLCNGLHKVAKIPQKATLNALQYYFQEKVQGGDKGGSEGFDGENKSCARIYAISRSSRVVRQYRGRVNSFLIMGLFM